MTCGHNIGGRNGDSVRSNGDSDVPYVAIRAVRGAVTASDLSTQTLKIRAAWNRVANSRVQIILSIFSQLVGNGLGALTSYLREA